MAAKKRNKRNLSFLKNFAERLRIHDGDMPRDRRGVVGKAMGYGYSRPEARLISIYYNQSSKRAIHKETR